MGEPYAYVVPNGDIYVSYEIVELLSDCGKGIDGIIAHELTHLVLRHSEVNYYVNRRIAKKNKTKSSVMAGLAGLATGALMIGAIEIGVRVDDVTPYTQLAANSALAIDEAYTVNTKRKQYLYSREQEIEADIVAVLYLKWNSYNPEDYVKALDRLPESFYISEYDTHPANEFRINFLKSFIRVGELQLKNEKEILNYNDDIYR